MALHILQNKSVNDDLFDKAAAGNPLSKFKIPDREADPNTMYRLIKDELMLDGNSRQNLATFCQTYAEDEVDPYGDLGHALHVQTVHERR